MDGDDTRRHLTKFRLNSLRQHVRNQFECVHVQEVWMSTVLLTLRKLPICMALLSSAAGFPAHATEPNVHTSAVIKDPSKLQVVSMLQEIYASPHPVQFQQIDVSDQAMKSIPVGTKRSAVFAAFKPVASSKIVKDTPETLVIRDDKGQAMLDPDARSVVITFSFDKEEKVRSVDAVYLKNQ